MQRFILNRRQMLGGLAAGAGLSLLGPMGRASAAVSEIVSPRFIPIYTCATETDSGTASA